MATVIGKKRALLKPLAVMGVLALVLVALTISSPSSPVGAHSNHTITTDTTLTGDHTGDIVIGADNITLDCAFFSVSATAGTPEFAGINLDGRTGVTVKNCEVSGFAFEGIRLANSTGNTLTNNTVLNNGRHGIDLSFSSNSNTLTGNTVTGSVIHGIQLSFTGGHTLTNNTIFNNGSRGTGGRGISGSFSSNNTVTNNTIRDNPGGGIDLFSSNNNTFTDNTISSNRDNSFGTGIKLWGSSSGNTIFHNNFINHPTQASDANPALNDWHEPTLLEGNFWSDYTGVDDGSGAGKHAIAGDGIGDTLIPHPAANFDNFPFTTENAWLDADGDGVPDPSDLCPGTIAGPVDANGCSDAQVDADGDGVCNPSAPSDGPSACTGSDLCPATPAGPVDANGCSDAQVDADGDGVCNPSAPSGGPSGCTGSDLCPATPAGVPVDANGCSPEQACTAIVGELQSIVDSNPGTKLADKVGEALAEAQSACDELAETPPDSKGASKKIAGAVAKLKDAIKEGLDPEQGTQLMDQLAGVARLLAADALAQAIACDPGHPDIADVQQALDDGDTLRASGAFKDAVKKYKDALAKAEGVLSSC